MSTISRPSAVAPPQTHPREESLRAAAQKLEASFLAEMLQHAGLGEMKGAFGGGEGEAQFASFLRREQAEAMAQAGGIGLAETFFEAMKRRESGSDRN